MTTTDPPVSLAGDLPPPSAGPSVPDLPAPDPAGEPDPGQEAAPDLAALLAEQQARLAAQDEEIQRLRQEAEALRQQAALAVTKYRDALLALHAEVPQALVRGDTLDAVETSFTEAQQAVMAVRQHLQTHAAALRVPAGAPVRGRAEVSALSPQEKIVLGLRQRRTG
ncbi:MAG: hypothetical protein HY689_16095 [Chloroflexi bacterium]|nr:hypothetical protein [Chloroflexota bacterium]